jgi:tRNA A-37 threonylcarbamoyl transferase component Bud32
MSDPKSPVAETASDGDLSGRQLAGYRLLRRLGRGAMAEVYLADQISLGRQVAVKVLRSNLAADATYVARFHQEARAAAQLVHANIVQIYEVGFAEGVHFIAQEYVQGLNLAELLARRGTPELPKVLAIVRHVAAALHKAAERGIVHRDIKPENIMLAATGDVKVADFGLARLYSQEDTLHLTQVGITMGTPLYMSPEQAEGKPLDTRSDIYSLGVTCYEMLSGEPPFRGETPVSIAVQHLQVPPQRLENIRPDLPLAVSRVVHKMLAKDPDERYATPRQLLHELRLISIELFQDDPGEEFEGWGGEDLPSTVEARRQATQRLAVAMKTSAMPRLRRGHVARWVAAAVGCLLLGAAAAWAVRERPLIAPGGEDETVSRQDTAEAQFVYAMMLGTEEAWKSVPQYFPQNKTLGRRAMQSLALLYLHDYDFKAAMRIFDDFADMNDAEVQFQAFGLAGQAVVLNRQRHYRESAEKLAQLWPLRNRLQGEMRVLIPGTLSSNRRALGNSPQLRDWSEWLRQSPPPADTRPAEPSSGAGPPAS